MLIYSCCRAHVVAVAVHPSGKLGLSVGSDRSLLTWDLLTGKLAFHRKITEGKLYKKSLCLSHTHTHTHWHNTRTLQQCRNTIKSGQEWPVVCSSSSLKSSSCESYCHLFWQAMMSPSDDELTFPNPHLNRCSWAQVVWSSLTSMRDTSITYSCKYLLLYVVCAQTSFTLQHHMCTITWYVHKHLLYIVCAL